MAWVKNSTPPTDLEKGFRQIVKLAGAGLSEQKASVQASARAPAPTTKKPTEMATAAADAATWLANTWTGNPGTTIWSAFYAARFKEIIIKNLAAPYWRSLSIEWDKTGTGTLSIKPFDGTINPAYDDPLHQPTSCNFFTYDRLYTTPTYPSYGADKSPGWAGTTDAHYFKDTWHATHIIAFTIPTPQRTTTRRPIILHVATKISCTATIRGNTTWFALGTKARIEDSSWSPRPSDRPITHYSQTWKFNRTLPGNSPGGWVHNETINAWRYGSWKVMDDQRNSGQIVLVEVGTPPSLGRYYARNDSVVVTHDDTAAVWWPQKPGEL